MTTWQWRESSDPVAMIRWLGSRGRADALWEFTIACCRRVWDQLPGDAFRRVVEHAERIGVHDIDESLAGASQALHKLERQFRKAGDADEQRRLNRRIGLGRMVFAFDYQDAKEAAESISGDLVEWSNGPDEERRVQADLLRQLVPDPTVRASEDEAS